MQPFKIVIPLGLGAFDELLETHAQWPKIDLLVLPERPRLAQFQSESLGPQLIIGVGAEHNGRLVLQQHRTHARRPQPGQLEPGMLPPFLPRVQRELLDRRAANGRVQIVMQPIALRQAEKAGGQSFQLAGPQGLGATALQMAAIEQPVDILLDKTRPTSHRIGIAEQEQNTCARFQVAARDAADQFIQQLDGCSLVAVDAGRQQQVSAIVTSLWRADFQCALAHPAHAHAFDGQLSLLRRLTSSQGQFKQFAEGEHGALP